MPWTFCSTEVRARSASFVIPAIVSRLAGVSASHPSAREPFRTAFCRTSNLSDERFERFVLRRCFPWWSRAIGAVVLALRPGLFQREFRVIAQLGRCTHPSQFGPEFEAYVYETVRDKARFRTRTLGLRLSRRRFERMAGEIWRHGWGGARSDTATSATTEATAGQG